MHPLIRCLAVAMALLGCLPLRAQNAPGGEPPPVTVQFRLLAWGADIPVLYYGANQKIAITENSCRSAIQTYSGAPVLSFTHVAKTADNRKPPPVVASVLIPQGAVNLTLLTAPAGHGRYVMYPIPDDSASLPPGHARLHNLTSRSLMVFCNGSQKIELASGASTMVSGTGKAIVVQVATMTNNRWTPLFNNVIQLGQPQGSNILFIAGQEGSGIGMFVLPAWPRKPKESAPSQPDTPES